MLKIKMRLLTGSDTDLAEEFDKHTFFPISHLLKDLEPEEEGIVFGVISDKKLIAACSIGGADEEWEVLGVHSGYSPESYLLSDLFVLPEYRGKGIAKELVEYSIACTYEQSGKHTVYVSLWEDKVGYFFKKLGFSVFCQHDYLLANM